MSTKYTTGDEIPLEVLVSRLDELSDAVTEGNCAINREFGMRIPAEVDHDADLVLSEAARRLSIVEVTDLEFLYDLCSRISFKDLSESKEELCKAAIRRLLELARTGTQS